MVLRAIAAAIAAVFAIRMCVCVCNDDMWSCSAGFCVSEFGVNWPDAGASVNYWRLAPWNSHITWGAVHIVHSELALENT